MASKLSVLGCLKCGEFVRSTMNDSIEQFEMHMCCETTLDEKRMKLLHLRDVINQEITNLGPPPPPLASHESPLPSVSSKIPMPPQMPASWPALSLPKPLTPRMPQGINILFELYEKFLEKLQQRFE